MANRDAPFGARIVGHLLGSDWNGKARKYTIPATDSTAVFMGDFVTHQGTSATGFDGELLPVVAQSAAGDALTGIVVGFGLNPSYLNQTYRTASTLRDVYVCDDPYVLFEIQSDGTGAVTDIGANADIVVGSGSTTTGLSAMELDESSVTTSTAQLRIHGISHRADNAIGASAVFICSMNESLYKSTTGA